MLRGSARTLTSRAASTAKVPRVQLAQGRTTLNATSLCTTITSVEVRALGETHGWNFYSDKESLRSSLTICRIKTSCGLEGVGGVTQYSENSYDRTTATHLLNHFVPKLLGKNPFLKEQIMSELVSNVYPQAPLAQAAVDIALWDLLGNATETPLYILLGGSRTSIPVQFSSPSFPTVIDYLKWVSDAIEQGCRRMKIHGFLDYEKDKILVAAVKNNVPSDVLLAFDVENRYSFQDAVRMSKLLTDLDYDWFEGPLPDKHFERYSDLTCRSSVDILPAGNSAAMQDLQSFADGCRRRCWSRARFDVTAAGGITQAQKYFSVAEAYGMQTEIQSWGHALKAAADLHLMLGLGGKNLGSSCFELAVPKEIYDQGMIDVIEFDDSGNIYAPNSHGALPGGLGVRVDWEEVDRLAYFNKKVDVGSRLITAYT